MGSVVRYRTGWRAHVCVSGLRRSKVFRTQVEARAWMEAVERDPAAQEPQSTFTVAAERWVEIKRQRVQAAHTGDAIEQSLRDYVLPLIGSMLLGDITRRHLVQVVRAVADRGTVDLAHRVGQRIRAILDLAVDDGLIQSHPGAGLSRVLPPIRKAHMAAVGPAELPALLAAIHGYPEPVTRAGLLLLAHTFTRTSELIGAQWTEIRDAQTWVIPGERMKRRIPHVVPLSGQVRALLEGLRPMTDDGPYILASGVNRECSISNNTLLFALYRLGYKGRMTGHGFRAVASSILNESGLWRHDAIERQLAHQETDKVRDAYNRAEYLDIRREMMQWWSDYLTGIMPTGSVSIPTRPGSARHHFGAASSG